MPRGKRSKLWKLWTVFGVIAAIGVGVFLYRWWFPSPELSGLEAWLESRGFTMFRPFREDWMPGSVIRISGVSPLSVFMASEFAQDLSPRYAHSTKVNYQCAVSIVSDGTGKFQLKELGANTTSSGKAVGTIVFTLKGAESLSLSVNSLCSLFAQDSNANTFMGQFTQQSGDQGLFMVPSASWNRDQGWGRMNNFLGLLGFQNADVHMVITEVMRADSVKCEFKQTDKGSFDLGADSGPILGSLGASFERQSDGVYVCESPICLGFKPIKLAEFIPYYTKRITAMNDPSHPPQPIPAADLPKPLEPQQFAKFQEAVQAAERDFSVICSIGDSRPFPGSGLEQQLFIPQDPMPLESVAGMS